MKDIKKTSTEDLMKLLAEKREAVRAFRFGIAGAGKKNVKAHMSARREIARILTEENSRRNESKNVIA